MGSCPPLFTGTASTLQDYLLLVFAPVSLCSGTRIPSIFPLPGPAARSRSQRGILAAGVRRPARGAPAFPLLHASAAPAHPNARAGLAQGGGRQGIPGEGGEGGFWGVSHPSNLQYSDLGRLKEEGYQGTGSMSSSSKSPHSTCIHLVLAGAGHTGAFLAVPPRGYHPPPAPESHPTTCLLSPGVGRALSRQPKTWQRSPCHPASWALGGCCSSDSSSRHMAAPKPACPGMPHLARVAAGEEGTAMTVPGRPWPGMEGLQHPWIKRILDGRCSLDGAGNPKNAGIFYAVPAGLQGGWCLLAPLRASDTHLVALGNSTLLAGMPHVLRVPGTHKLTTVPTTLLVSITPAVRLDSVVAPSASTLDVPVPPPIQAVPGYPAAHLPVPFTNHLLWPYILAPPHFLYLAQIPPASLPGYGENR